MNKNKILNKLDSPKVNTNANIHALSHDGRGIATVENKTTFIAGALPGEVVTFKITQKRSTYNEAQILDIITASPERITPPCQHFGLCGGCSLQHMSIETQLQLKQQILLDQLKHFGKVTPEHIMPPLNAQSIGYRRKARLGAKFVIKKDKVLVGFREKSSSYLADLESCIVLHPEVGQRLLALRQLIASLELIRHIPQIEIAIGDTDVALVFRHMEIMPDSDQDKLKEFGKKNNMHIYLQPNAPALVHKIWPEDNHERLTYTLPDYGLEFLFHPLDFTQINLEINRLMVKQAISLLELNPTDSVLDLFCGIGNFTLPIAKHVKRVIGIEGGLEMVARANDNAAHNYITNAEFYAANLDKPTQDHAWMNQPYDKILMDPPRVGAKEILPFIPQFNAKRIVYVSCNPATLARDAGELVHQYGYQLKQVGIMNMFPHTSHIEAMAVFRKIIKKDKHYMETELKNLPIIDWKLSTKLAGNKKNLAEDILALLIQSLPKDIKLINQLYETQNYPEMLVQVHKLHGAVCYCGIPRIKTILVTLETNLKNNIMVSSSFLLNHLNTEVNHLLEHYANIRK